MNTTSPNDRPTRRLSAVMFTDMVGYSNLVQRNESLGLALLAEQRAIVREILPRHGGRVVDTIGDAFFVEFGSALEATECAIEIQGTLHARNATEPADRHIVLRIGLHLGDVVHVGDQVQGDGVNIAARMEPLARPGSICVSEDVARQVHNKIDLPVLALGPRQLKNIRLPMNAYRIVMPWEEDFESDKASAGLFGTGLDRQKRRLPVVTTGVAVLAVAALAWFALDRFVERRTSPDHLDVSPSLVAVLPFTVQGSESYAYLGKGMVDLLSTKLDGAGTLRTVDPRAVHGLVTQASLEDLDPHSAREIAGRLGAGTFVLGNIIEVGGRLRIDASVYRGDRLDPSEQGTVEGVASEVFDLLDELATQLVVLDRGVPGVTFVRLESMTTSSFESLKHYLHGVDAFRAARFQTAADELRMAVDGDSTFALAWYQLSATAEWLFDSELAQDAIEKALRHSARLSERGRRLVEALAAAKSGRNAEALERYREILTSYPDDVEAWYQLGELIFHAGPLIGVPPQESLEAWNRLLFYEPDQVTALIHMARIWLYNGNADKVDSLAQVVFSLAPDADRKVELQAHLAFNRDGNAALEQVMGDLSTVGDDMLLEVIWSLAVFREDLEPALSVASVATAPTRSNETRATGHIVRAYFYAALGRFSEAEGEFDKAAEIDASSIPEHRAMMAILPYRSSSPHELLSTQRYVEAWDAAGTPPSSKTSSWFTVHDGINEILRDYLLGTISALRGQHSQARDMVARLERAEEPKQAPSLPFDLATGIRAQIQLDGGNKDAAERLLRQIKRYSWYQFGLNSVFISLARERFVLGRLLEEQGDYEGAIRSMSFFERHSMFDWVYVAQSHLARASAYEALGNRAEAARHLARFIELWRDCDEEFRPLMTEARQRLDALSE